jgi:hypothetical protein
MIGESVGPDSPIRIKMFVLTDDSKRMKRKLNLIPNDYGINPRKESQNPYCIY